MSTYPFMARAKTRRNNGEIVSGMAIDDYFGRHQYGYKVTGKHHVMRQKTFEERYEMLESTYEGNHGTWFGGSVPEMLDDSNVQDAIKAFKENKVETPDEDDPRSRTFLLTDACLWEAQKANGTFHPHAIEVVDVDTGQVRYIESGARIKFVEGSISEGRDQNKYNNYA